jgi:exopolyphosphatase / guanosine-5'-triphosphate,3'-diphosphate pyrophosphatase
MPTPDNTYAALDLGSNSFHLLVARFENNKLVVIDRHKENVRMASGLRSDGSLSKVTMDRALASLARFAERLRSTPNAHLRVVGTNTLRKATNTHSFLERAEDILQSPIDIISGIEEARLIYLGVADDLAPESGKRLVVDIGGGSTELVIGQQTPEQLESLYIGCVSHSERFFPEGNINPDAYYQAVIAAQAEIQWVSNVFSHHHWHEAVGSSGTIRTIEKMLYEMGLAPNHTITLNGIHLLSNKLCTFTHCDDIDLAGLSEERRSVLPGGLAVLHAIFLELGIDEMHVSANAIREGIVLDLAGRFHNHDKREETVEYLMQQYHVDRKQVKRVQQLAQVLLAPLQEEFAGNYATVERTLDWAISLHEIGLSISHNGYQKHSAYLLLHSDMPGFSRQEQKLLSFLVLNHRRKLKPLQETYGFDPDWRQVQILRLAFLFNRRRDDNNIPPELGIKLREKSLRLQISKQWLDEHPLTSEDLKTEQRYMKSLDIEMVIERKS